MKRLLGLFALIFVFTLPAKAQQTPAFDLEGAYLNRSYYPPNASRFAMNGWDGTLNYNLRRWLGVAGDVSGAYSNRSITDSNNQTVPESTQIYTFMAGPRIYPFSHRHKLIPYGQVLFGVGYNRLTFPATAGFPSLTTTSTAFSWEAGGGVDLKLSPNWALRAFEFDYEHTGFNNYPNQNTTSQGNYRISIGIVYHIGTR